MRFAFYCLFEDWPAVVEQSIKTEAHLRANGRPLAADRMLRAYAAFREEMVKLGVGTAVAGTVELREIERRTRVRPDTGGGGGSRLQDALVVKQLAAGLLPGNMGIADLDLLDAKVPWWKTNEVGSHARVGGELFGTFYGAAGAGPPNPDQFRQHPLFQAGDASGVAGFGIIERPIPARWFITRSAKIIDSAWRAQFETIRARFESRVGDVALTKT